jgi:hypothetical protein
MDRDSLGPADVQLLVHQAGGTKRTSRSLGVPFDDVVRWSREGLSEPERACKLIELAHFGERMVGRRRRSALVTVEELQEVVARYEKRADAARVLGASERALRRYLSGERVPPRDFSEQVLARLSPNHLPMALSEDGTREADATPDHLPRL